MLLIKLPTIIVKLRHYYNNNGQPYFQLAIPKNIRHFYQGKKTIRHKLSGNYQTWVIEIDRLRRHYVKEFAALKSGDTGTPDQIQKQAVALLASFDLLPGAGNQAARGVPAEFNQFPHLEYIEEYLDEKRQTGQFTKVDELASLLLTKPLPLLLSNATEVYFENHQKGMQEKFRKDTLKRWMNIYKATGGDMHFEDVSRDMAKRYVLERLNTVKTSTVDRELKTIRAIFNMVIREKGLNHKNPFENLVIPSKGKDSIKRVPFDHDEYKKLIFACMSKNDEIRTLILVVCLTGARPSEVAGLRRQDIYIDDQYPHFDLVEYGDRTLKTKGSFRKVPLIPLALQAVKEQLARHNELAVFPRYCDGNDVNGDALSAATKRYIESLGINKTLYSARHTVKTLLDQSGVSEYLAESIGGWGQKKVSRGYGDGHSLAQKSKALSDALSPILVDSL